MRVGPDETHGRIYFYAIPHRATPIPKADARLCNVPLYTHADTHTPMPTKPHWPRSFCPPN